MANEELNQQGYLVTGKLVGDKFGEFERLNIGSTSIRELKTAGVDVIVPQLVEFPFKYYKPTKSPMQRSQNYGDITPITELISRPRPQIPQ